MAQDHNKISPLKNDYHRQKLASFQAEQKRLIFRRRRLFFLFFVAIAIVGFSAFSFFNAQQKLNALKKDESSTITSEQVLVEQEDNLKDDVALLKNDDYVGKLARARYLLSKTGESVYTLPSTDATADAEKTAQSTPPASSTTDSSQTATSGENK